MTNISADDKATIVTTIRQLFLFPASVPLQPSITDEAIFLAGKSTGVAAERERCIRICLSVIATANTATGKSQYRSPEDIVREIRAQTKGSK